MRRTLSGLVGLTLAGLLGCGGIVQGGTDSESGGAMSTATGGSNGNESFGSADTAVGECVEGLLEADAAFDRCAWVALGRCYMEREMACNCACPHDRNSQCSSGFGGPGNGHVKVSCS